MTYVRDTTDFLNKIAQIQHPLPDVTIILCLDVKALYPSVPREEAHAAVSEALNRRLQPDVGTNDMIIMMDTVINNKTISSMETTTCKMKELP
ncbi:hypothetical protein DPMN_125454 [Dreissena polymorpha]|uniref:Reverse transcriptase domain-containing protein n=1 Tax=Dreissena polymorpha TaxID=45954 RepID=A0A9D4GVB5_DREPO|nr:hypothetical protein DPMN_125454 [Dreissena polymorpha]